MWFPCRQGGAMSRLPSSARHTIIGAPSSASPSVLPPSWPPSRRLSNHLPRLPLLLRLQQQRHCLPSLPPHPSPPPDPVASVFSDLSPARTYASVAEEETSAPSGCRVVALGASGWTPPTRNYGALRVGVFLSTAGCYFAISRPGCAALGRRRTRPAPPCVSNVAPDPLAIGLGPRGALFLFVRLSCFHQCA